MGALAPIFYWLELAIETDSFSNTAIYFTGGVTDLLLLLSKFMWFKRFVIQDFYKNS